MGMTREEAIYEISTSGDPQEYEKAINFAIEALKNDVPREKFEAMMQAIDQLPTIIVKDKDGEADVFCSMTGVLQIARFFGECEKFEADEIKVKWAIKYIKDYCRKNAECEKCRFFQKERNMCEFVSIPTHWETPERGDNVKT